MRRRQVTGIPPMAITVSVGSLTIIQKAATIQGMPVTIMTPAQEAVAITTVLDIPANAPTATEMEDELSVPETILPVLPSTNESQLGASYLYNGIHQAVQNTNVSVHSSDSYAQENPKSFLNKKLNDKIYSSFKETFSNTNLDSVVHYHLKSDLIIKK